MILKLSFEKVEKTRMLFLLILMVFLKREEFISEFGMS